MAAAMDKVAVSSMNTVQSERKATRRWNVVLLAEG